MQMSAGFLSSRNAGATARRLFFLLAFQPVSGHTQDLKNRLSNQEVIEMARMGISDEVIVAKIRNSAGPESRFDTSLDGLRALKAASISDAVIKAMVGPVSLTGAMSGPDTAQLTGNAELPPPEVGVYWRDEGRFVLLQGQAISQTKVGGKAGNLFTYGMRSEHWDAYLNGPVSNNHVKDRRPAFCLYVPDGSSAADFVLIRLEKKADRREFQIGSFGGMTGGKSGVKKNVGLGFKSEHIGIRSYRIQLDAELPAGEYAFIMLTGQQASMGGSRSSTTSGGSASGRIYDFNISE